MFKKIKTWLKNFFHINPCSCPCLKNKEVTNKTYSSTPLIDETKPEQVKEEKTKIKENTSTKIKESPKITKTNNSIHQKETMTPFVKWVGGKRQILKHIKPLLPKEFNTYIEPFVGGGALFFDLQHNKSIINDFNKELMNSFKVIKTSHEKLLKTIDSFHEQHSKEFYYELRAKQSSGNNIEDAARFMYINKTCFNGMYRVNSKGEFNVPFNNKTKEELNIYNKTNIEAISRYLNESNVQILSEDYLITLDRAKSGDFVFCDPPYDKEKDVSEFVSYSKESFDRENQKDLFNKLVELDNKGVKWMLTNSNTAFIRELYKDFISIEILANRMLNSNKDKRTNTGKELIIRNYE